MKVWTKIHLNNQNKKIALISKSFTNYLYGQGPITDIVKKYRISEKDYQELSQYTADRISGILMLYLAKDINRINDIVNKYNLNNGVVNEISPEIEGYIDKDTQN